MKRRAYLALGAAGLGGLAGCGQRGGPETTRGPTEPPEDGPGPETASDAEGKDETALPSLDAVDTTREYVYVNDIPPDNFNGELALAMASQDDGIDLRGFLNEFPPVPWWDSEQRYETAKSYYRKHHRLTHDRAVESGFSDLPPAQYGLFERHRKPESGEIADTEPIGSEGTNVIVEAAKDASPQNPLVVAVGGPVCTVADAYLQEPSIADSVVVFWRTLPPWGELWNMALSGWSATVVVKNLRTVICFDDGSARITREQVQERLPDEPLKQYILNKKYDGTGENPLSSGERYEGDANTILSPCHPDTRAEVENLRFEELKSHWILGQVMPELTQTTERTNITAVRKHENMTERWWSHMGNESAWD